MEKAPISKIFFSIQGEGIFLGAAQVFIRFSGCNLKKCLFCDEDSLPKYFKSVKDIILKVKKLSKGMKLHSVSLTGGEPLKYPRFLKELGCALKKDNFLVYLETNGTLPENLKYVKNYIDIVAMDIKLPSSTGGDDFFDAHEKFLRLSLKKRVFIKVVITKKTAWKCFKKAVDLVRKTGREIPFVIQPVTRTALAAAPGREKILLFQKYGLRFLEDVRIIPQIHKHIGVE